MGPDIVMPDCKQVSVHEVVHEKPELGLCARRCCNAAMHFLRCAHFRALRGQIRPRYFDGVCYRISMTVFQEHRKEHWRVDVRKVCGDEELERSVHSVEVMALWRNFRR